MKISPSRIFGRSFGGAAAVIALAAGLAWTPPSNLAEAQSTYQPWTGTQQGQLTAQMLKDLKAVIAQGEKDQAASPDFLADLKKVVATYEASMTPSEAKPFLDEFADGEFATNPAWKVTAGAWAVDTGGSNRGLVSKMRQQQNLQSLLGGLLNPQSQTTQSQSQQYAAIYTKAKLPAAFSFNTRFTSKDRYGGLYMSLYQGASAQNQYRLVYQPGNQASLVLQRVSQQGATNLGTLNGVLNLEDGKPHDVTMSRDAAGKILVTVDGKQAITATDTTLKGDFDGILYTNVGGSYWIRRVSVDPKS